MKQFWRSVYVELEKIEECSCPLILQVFLVFHFVIVYNYNKLLVTNLQTASRVVIACSWKSEKLPTITSWLMKVNKVMLMNKLYLQLPDIE